VPPEAQSKRAKIKDAQEDTSPAFNLSFSRSRRRHVRVRVRGLYEAAGEPHWYYIQGAGGEESASVTAISLARPPVLQWPSGARTEDAPDWMAGRRGRPSALWWRENRLESAEYGRIYGLGGSLSQLYVAESRAEILFLALARVFLVGSGWEVDGPRMLAEGSREGHHWRSLENSQLDSGTEGRIPVFFGRLAACVTCGAVTCDGLRWESRVYN
jgi:hypothetical protein